MKEKLKYIFWSVVSLLGSFGLPTGYSDFHELSEQTIVIINSICG
jgi:hypothetical protein